MEARVWRVLDVPRGYTNVKFQAIFSLGAAACSYGPVSKGEGRHHSFLNGTLQIDTTAAFHGRAREAKTA